MYEDETQNYDPEIRNEYLIGLAYTFHTFPLAISFIVMCSL